MSDKEPELGITARGQVLRVIDGDTVVVELRVPVNVRIKDLWAPEMRGPESEAGKRSKAELVGMLPKGKKVVVNVSTKNATNLSGVLTFGRVVGSIWATVRGKRGRHNIAKEMIRRGFGTRTKE